MKKIIRTAVILIIAALFIGGAFAAPAIGGDKGSIVITSNAEGATVDFLSINTDVLYTATITNGEAVFEVYSTATPVSKAVVYCDGYKPAYCVVEGNPVKGETKTYTVNLEELPKNPAPGGFEGYILIAANNPGVKVELLDVGNIVMRDGVLDENGVLIIHTYMSATPIKSMKLYTTENPPALSIETPASGETLVHYVTAQNPTTPIDTPKPVETEKDKPPYMETETPASPLGVSAGLLGVLGAALLLRRE